MEPFFIITESTAFEGELAKLEGGRVEEGCGWGVGMWRCVGGVCMGVSTWIFGKGRRTVTLRKSSDVWTSRSEVKRQAGGKAVSEQTV